MNFSMGQILSVASGRLMCANIGMVYEILGFLYGEQVFTHQIPRVLKQVRPLLFSQCPWLDQDGIKLITKENWTEKLAAHIEQFGNSHELIANPEMTEKIDPVTKVVNIWGESNVIVI